MAFTIIVIYVHVGWLFITRANSALSCKNMQDAFTIFISKQHASRSCKFWNCIIKVKYCEANKDNTLQQGLSIYTLQTMYTPHKLPRRGQNINTKLALIAWLTK
jgi:acyl carrier protein phosphodiesterase